MARPGYAAYCHKVIGNFQFPTIQFVFQQIMRFDAQFLPIGRTAGNPCE
jgi:hypothetical protein